MSAEPAATLLGVAAAAVGLTSYLQARALAFKLQVGASSLLWGVHFGLLGAHSAMTTQFAIGVRTWCTVGRLSRARAVALFCASSAVFAVLAWWGWDGWISLLPLAAAINSTAAMLRPSNRGMRVQLLASSMLWIGTGLYWLSWPILVTEGIAVAANLRTIARLRT